MKNPKISIIIPVYNVEKYLRQCLDSVVNQTMSEIEVICIDDGSTDGSGAILDEYAARDQRFVVIHKVNEGQSIARNLGIELSKGEYIAFLDSDDWLVLSMCEKVYTQAKKTQSDVMLYFFHCVGFPPEREPGFSQITKNCYTDTIEKWNLVSLCWNVVWNQLYKRQFIIDNNIHFLEGIIFEDNHFTIKIAYLVKEIHVYKEKLINYRYGSGYATDPKQSFKRLRQIEMFEALLTDMQKYHLTEKEYLYLIGRKFSILYHQYLQFPCIRRSLIRSLRIDSKNNLKEWELINNKKVPLPTIVYFFYQMVGGNFCKRNIIRIKFFKVFLADWLARQLVPHSVWLQSVLDTINDQRLEIERLKNNEKS